VTLTIHTEEDEQRQLKVTVEVAEERVQQQMRQTARQIARGINIPGFRRGKVPYNILVQRVGKEALRSEAVEELLTPVFEETMAQIEATPYSQPQLEDMQMEPLVVEFSVPLEPVVELGDYRAIRRELQTVEVSEEAVSEALEQVRQRHQILEPVDRPAMEGDVVVMSATGEVVEDDRVEVIYDEERAELLMDPEETFAGTDFVQKIIGLEVGDETEFTITLPEAEEEADEEEDAYSLAGKEAQFSVTILDVKSRYLPELDDELAREEGDYETLDDLRAAVRKELEEQAESEARGELLDSFVDELAEQAEELLYPPVAVEEDLDRRLESLQEQVTRAGWQWEDYLMLQGASEESLREEWYEGAVENVERGLLFRELIQQEKLTISEEELQGAIDERLARFDDNDELRQQMRNFFLQGQGLDMLSSEILMDKVYDRVEAIVTGHAPDLAELEAEAATAVATLEEEE
jgi:trigger factor